MTSRLPGVFDTSPRSSVTGRGSISVNRPPAIIEDNNEDEMDADDTNKKESANANADTRHHTKLKRVNSTPVWPTELPDVFAFPDSFFQLQRDLGYSVLEYLVKRGYADAAESFVRELEPECGIGGILRERENEKIPDTDANADANADTDTNTSGMDAFDRAFEEMEQEYDQDASRHYEDKFKQEEALRGINKVKDRKEVMKLIIDGKIEDCIALIYKKWPHFFREDHITTTSGNNMLKLRLRHLQVIIQIEDFAASSEEERKSNGGEPEFMKSTVAFIQKHLTDPQILSSDQFVEDMETTMCMLAYGVDSSPATSASFGQLTSPQRRRALAEDVNSALQGTIEVGTPRLQQLAKLALHLNDERST
jgi:hypothetical protein